MISPIPEAHVGSNQLAPKLNSDDLQYSPEESEFLTSPPPQESIDMGPGTSPSSKLASVPGEPQGFEMHAVQLLNEVPPLALGTAEQIAKFANKKLISNDILTSAATGVSPHERVSQLSQATQQEAMDQQNAQTGNDQLEQIKQSWLEADMQFQQHLAQMPNIPEKVKAEMSDPQIVFSLLAGLLTGTMAQTGQILNATQEAVQHRADRENQLNRQHYSDEMQQWKDEGAGLRDQMTETRAMAHQEENYDLGRERLDQVGARDSASWQDHEQDNSRELAAQLHRQIEQYRSYESKLAEYGEEDLKARDQFILAMVREYGNLGLTEDDVRAALGAPRQIGSRSVLQQNSDLSAERNRDRQDGEMVKRMHSAYRDVISQLSGLAGGITKAHVAELRQWIQTNVPQEYRREFILPSVGEKYQAFLGRLRAASNGSTSRRRRRR